MLLEVKNIKKYFETPRGLLHAVDDVSFSLGDGQTMGIVGESGCGKTTLGRVLVHLLESTSGKLIYDGKDITRVNKSKLKKLQREMQIIFQDPYSSLNPRMTVSEIIAEPLHITKIVPKNEIDQTVFQMMDIVGLASRLVNSYPHELDGGRRQRIGVARALVMNPKFIVCDEPVSALDVSIQAQIINLLLDLQKEMGLAYLFITHDLSVVRYLSHRITVMYLGQMVEQCDTETLFRNPIHPYTKALLSAIPIPDPDSKKQRIIIEGEVSSPIEPGPGCRFAPRCRYISGECPNRELGLKEVEPGHFVACQVI